MSGLAMCRIRISNCGCCLGYVHLDRIENGRGPHSAVRTCGGLFGARVVRSASAEQQAEGKRGMADRSLDVHLSLRLPLGLMR